MMYGWFIVPVALLMVVFIWKKLRFAAGRPAWGGLVLLLVSFGLTIWDRLEACPALAMILCIPAVAWTGWGRTVARLLFFPVVFLLFIIPLNLPGLDNESLCTFSGVVSSALMNGIGFHIELLYELDEHIKGVFLTNSAQTFQFHVADVCSGKRSFTVMLVMSAVYGFFHYKTLPRILVLMACSILFALVANIFRIIAMCVYAHFYGGGKTFGLFHDTDGLVMFFIAFVLLAKVGDKYFYKIGKNPSQIPPAPPARQSSWPVGITAIVLGIVLTILTLLFH